MLGFPVIWVYSDSLWYGSVDLSITLALRHSLQKALNQTGHVPASTVVWNDHEVQDIMISDGEPLSYSTLMLSAIQTLKQYHKRLEVFDMRSEDFLGKGPFVVNGVILGEEVSL
ncbi:hypothetical protein D3C77_533670 [compost metagenome]